MAEPIANNHPVNGLLYRMVFMSFYYSVRITAKLSIVLTAALVATVARAGGTAYEISRHDLFFTLDRSCLVEPGDPYQIIAPLDGLISRHVEEAQSVENGALLGLYDVASLERDLDLARSRQATIAARLAQISGPLTEAQRKLRALDMAAIERRVAEAQEAHVRVAELAGDGRLSEQRSLESLEALRQVEDELAREQTRATIFEIETELQIADLHNAEREAQVAVARLVGQLEQARVATPVSGQISYAHPGLARAGSAYVQAGAHIFSVSQPQRRWARVGMTAGEADRMRSGSVAIIDDHGVIFDAEILRVAMRDDVAGWEKERFQFLVGFDAPPGTFLVGSETICAFRAMAAENTVAAPLNYLTQDGDETVVLRLIDDRVERMVVVTGIVDPPLVEVTVGLAPGDRITRP